MSSDARAAARTLLFLVALVGLLAAARTGTPQPVVLLLVSVLVAVAAVWVHGQWVDDLDGHQWAPPLRGSGAVVGLGAALVVLYAARPQLGGWGLLGVLLAYLGTAMAITRLRQSAGPPVTWAWALGLTGSGAVLLLLGVLLLGRRTTTSWALLGVALLVLLPVGGTFLAERAVRWATVPAHGALADRLGLAGLALFALMAALAGVAGHSRWAAVAVVVTGLLVAALVSGTQADLVAVMVVVALLGVTSAQQPLPPEAHPGGRQRVLVSLGDSYMSGEGASVYYEGTDEGGGDQCRRSPTSWAAVAGVTGEPAPRASAADPPGARRFDGVDLLACSGARTANLLHEQTDLAPAGARPVRPAAPQGGTTQTQLDAYVSHQQAAPYVPALVVLSIGGNDAGFSSIGLMCLAPGDCDERASLWTSTFDQLAAQLDLAYDEVAAQFPGTPVAVVPYPDPFYVGPGSHCGELALSRSEIDFVRSFLGADGSTPSLNATVRAAAEAHGFAYLDGMQDALAAQHLQLCDPANGGRPGINFIGLRSVSGAAEQRFHPKNWSHSSLHPDERGHAALLRAFEQWLPADLGTLPTRVPVPVGTGDGPAAQAVAQAAAPQEPCDLFDPTPSGCRPQATRWAAGQVRDLALGNGLVAALALLGAATAAAMLLGNRRRWWAAHPPAPPP